MKTIILSLLSFFALFSVCSAKFEQGDVEIGFNLGMGVVTMEYTIFSQNHTESQNYFGLSFTPGYYLFDGFSFEPEIGITAIDEERPSFFLLANISYSHIIENKNWGPFFKVGYGISNSLNQYPGELMLMYAINDLDLRIINASAGIKVIIEDILVLRSELNYRNITSKNSNSSGISWISVITGFSILI